MERIETCPRRCAACPSTLGTVAPQMEMGEGDNRKGFPKWDED